MNPGWRSWWSSRSSTTRLVVVGLGAVLGYRLFEFGLIGLLSGIFLTLLGGTVIAAMPGFGSRFLSAVGWSYLPAAATARAAPLVLGAAAAIAFVVALPLRPDASGGANASRTPFGTIAQTTIAQTSGPTTSPSDAARTPTAAPSARATGTPRTTTPPLSAISGILTFQRRNEFAQVNLADGSVLATGDGYSPYLSVGGETAFLSTATNSFLLYTRAGARIVIAQHRQPLGIPLFGPTVSPDGNLIAYSDFCDRECPDAGSYTLIRGRDGQLRYAFKDMNPEDWTPDGRLIMTGGDPFAIRVAPGIYVASSDFKTVTQLLSGRLYSPRMSPDGSRIAYVGTNGNVWTSRSDGSAPIQLTSFGPYQDFPTWSPDGRWLAIQFESAGTKLGDSNVIIVPSSSPAQAPIPRFYAGGAAIKASEQMTWR